MNDQGFPHIQYTMKQDPHERGLIHGEEFAKGIKELSLIRKELMIQKSPHLESLIPSLAQEQANLTKDYDNDLYKELEGISKGSDVSIENLIILNNYTDFRDINLPDQGCTSLSINRESKVSAQTWDMHSSAKNYVCTIQLDDQWCVFSLVGCLGMMGINKSGQFIGVNNINTNDAKPGIIWSSFVRKYLNTKNFEEGLKLLKTTPFTSGHNYLLSDGKTFQHWEASPTRIALASSLDGEKGIIYHTNHCLTPELISIEESLSQNSTSLNRFQLLKDKAESIKNSQDVFELLQNHDGYPKSICGHYQSGAQDPSTTCGGAVFDYSTNEFKLWRGCPKEDDNYKERMINLN